jgi:predicted permease
MIVINTIIPVFFIIALGTILKQTKFLPELFFKQSNKLVYWIGLPCLLFNETAHSTFSGGRSGRIFLLLLTGMFACMVCAYIISFLMRVPSVQIGALVQGAFRGNLAFISLPIILFSFQAANGIVNSDISSIAALALAPTILCYNVISVIVLSIHQKKDHKNILHLLSDTVKRICTNPLLIACLVGILFSFYSWTVPVPINKIVKTLGNSALPLALIVIGSSLDFSKLKGRRTYTLTAAIIKVVMAPIAGFFLAPFFGIHGPDLRIALTFLAAPTAAASHVMAAQMGSDETLAGSIIVVSTLLSFVSLTVVLLIS